MKTILLIALLLMPLGVHAEEREPIIEEESSVCADLKESAVTDIVMVKKSDRP